MADDSDPDPGRRRFLKIATCGLGAGIGIAVTVPAVGYIIHPAGRKVVTTPAEPIEVAMIGALPQTGLPVRVQVIAPTVRDAWTSATDVPLGAAWLRRDGDKVSALSGICPHLGCAIALDPVKKLFVCPCHDSAFDAMSGRRLSGPAKRDLDPLDAKIDEQGRIKLTWIKFKADIDKREPA
jgi:menaquinol-cytochrome c reductase iron-sulfur subunit